jgi:hypothetical protein
MARRRTTQEIEELVEQYRRSGMTRVAYSHQAGVPLSTLGHYLRRRRSGQRLVKVKLNAAAAPAAEDGFVLTLNKGRRIQSGWGFGEAELARLIRVVEGA